MTTQPNRRAVRTARIGDVTIKLYRRGFHYEWFSPLDGWTGVVAATVNGAVRYALHYWQGSIRMGGRP